MIPYTRGYIANTRSFPEKTGGLEARVYKAHPNNESRRAREIAWENIRGQSANMKKLDKRRTTSKLLAGHGDKSSYGYIHNTHKSRVRKSL
jgi:hypothetical protein